MKPLVLAGLQSDDVVSSEQGDSMTRSGKIALNIFAIVTISVLVSSHLLRPVFLVSIFNNTSSNVTVWSANSDESRGLLVRVGKTQLTIPSKSSAASIFNQVRICPASRCRLSPYPIRLVLIVQGDQRTYSLLLPAMGSAHNTCDNLHFCTVRLRLEPDGNLYYWAQHDGIDGSEQPFGFPASPISKS